MKASFGFEIDGLDNETDMAPSGELGAAAQAMIGAALIAAKDHPILVERFAAGDVKGVSNMGFEFPLSLPPDAPEG